MKTKPTKKEIQKLIGLQCKLKGLNLHQNSGGMPDHFEFLPFRLCKDLGGGKAGIMLNGSGCVYSVDFCSLEFLDERETQLRRQIESVMFS